MQLLTPKAVSDSQPPAPRRLRQTLLRAAGFGLLLLALVCLYYAPAFTAPDPLPQKHNLASRLGLPYSQTFYVDSLDWQAARAAVQKFRLPLWQNDRPLLAGSEVPLLYPPALLYYFGPEKWGWLLYAILHTWIAAVGGLVVLWSFKNRRGTADKGAVSARLWWVLSGVIIAGYVVIIGQMSSDNQAVLSWLPWLGWLPFSRRKYIRLVALSLVLGLVVLALGKPDYAAVAIGATCLWFLLVNSAQGGWKPGAIARATLFAIIVGLLGYFLAGPQLFPRLITNSNPFVIGLSAPQPVYVLPLEAAQVATGGSESVGQYVANPQFNPAKIVVIEEQPKVSGTTGPNLPIVTKSPGSTRDGGETRLELSIKAGTGPFWLVLPERYDNGWAATLLKGNDPKKGAEATLYRANGGWRAFLVEPPDKAATFTTDSVNSVRIRYNPLAFTLGLYAAFLAIASLLLIGLVLAWVRFYREEETDHPLRRIFKNSVTPMFAQLTGKVIDFGFAVISLRLLGPEGNGSYTLATTTWLIFNTISDFGLETLTTREVARNRDQDNANRYFSTMLAIRTGLAVITLPLALFWLGGLSLTSNVRPETIWAALILMLTIIPGGLAASMSAIFRAYEKFEFLAANQLLWAVIRVPIALAALLIGWGVIGLATAALVVNLIGLAALMTLFRQQLFKPNVVAGFDRKLIIPMLKTSFPLMLNGLLVSLFFKVDVFLLAPFRGEREVGLYNSAYKYIDALLIFPTAITLALFPLFSSYSVKAKDSMYRAYREALRLLCVLALPISAGMLFVAHDLIATLGGNEFLPEGAIALQILIWFLPFSYINGVTQYVLIALDMQRTITWAVLTTVVVNVALNLTFIPFFGYIATSAVTIASEIVLLSIYFVIMRRAGLNIPLTDTLLRPTGAALVMVAVLFGLTNVLGLNNFVVIVAVGAIVYGFGLILTRSVTKTDTAYLNKLIKR